SDHPYSYATSVLFLQSPPRPPSPTPFPYTTLFRYREQHHHGHGFPRRGVLPQGHVAARRERRALDAVVESAAPLQHPQHRGCPRARQRQAPRKGQEQAEERERDGAEEGPEAQEAGEERR